MFFHLFAVLQAVFLLSELLMRQPVDVPSPSGPGQALGHPEPVCPEQPGVPADQVHLPVGHGIRDEGGGGLQPLLLGQAVPLCLKGDQGLVQTSSVEEVPEVLHWFWEVLDSLTRWPSSPLPQRNLSSSS